MRPTTADQDLITSGNRKIRWAAAHMPVLEGIRAQFEKDKPFEGLQVAVSVHMEAKTACLCLALQAGGAEVYAMGCNPLSSQDDVCAALLDSGMAVYAKHGCTMEEYYDFLKRGLSGRPHIIVDDGGDLTQILHEEHPEYAERLIGGCEETRQPA